MTDITNAKILILATNGFEQSELEKPLNDLRDRGVSIQSEDIGWVVSTTAFGPQTETE